MGRHETIRKVSRPRTKLIMDILECSSFGSGLGTFIFRQIHINAQVEKRNRNGRPLFANCTLAKSVALLYKDFWLSTRLEM